MPVNFSNFAEGSPPAETDQVVGYSIAASGGERRWTLPSLRSSLIKGAASTISVDNLANSKAIVSTNQGKVGTSTTTSTEIGYLAGARSNIQQQIDSSIPAGAVMPFAMATAPSGWLVCDGSAITRTGYSNLFAAIGTLYGVGNNSTTFNLPDLRGYFVRGHGKNTDGVVSGAFGVKQEDMFKSHVHKTYGAWSDDDDEGSGSNPSAKARLTDSTPAGGTETRPRNIAMLYCIKI